METSQGGYNSTVCVEQLQKNLTVDRPSFSSTSFVGPSPGWLFPWPSQEEEGRRATRASQYQKCRGFYYFYFYQNAELDLNYKNIYIFLQLTA